MFELIVRITLATAVLLLSGATGSPPFDPTWRAVAFFATYSFLAYAMEKRGVRNSGVAGLFAVADSAVIALLLAATGRVETLGFLILLPPGWAALRYGADALAMSPVVACWLLVAANMFDGKGFTPTLLAQACGVLLIGLLGAKRSQIVTLKEFVEVPSAASPAEPVTQEFFELREKFRVLRDHAGELERKGRRDRFVVQLSEAFESDPESGLVALTRKLRELLHVDGLTLHSLNLSANRLTVHVVAGDVPPLARDVALELPGFLGEWQLKERLTASLNALRSPEEASNAATVILKDKGRIVGVLALYDTAKQTLADAVEAASEIGEAIAKFLRMHEVKDDERRRMRQAEMLYMVASTGQGSDSPSTLASRVARELWESLRLDNLTVCFLENDQAVLAASQGSQVRVLEAMSLGGSQGLTGWLSIGSPELVLLDARDDDRLPREEALKRRIGSFVLVPLSFDETVYGYMSATTNRVLGIDGIALETLRLAAAELSQGLGRIEHGHKDPAGLATPVEFYDAVKCAGDGHFVYLEVLRRDELADTHGKPAVEYAARKLASRLRALLPVDGLICRRMEGDFVAFLRTDDESYAKTWAANAAAAASMVAVTTPDGLTKLPLAVRSKVARLSQQSNQISTGATL